MFRLPLGSSREVATQTTALAAAFATLGVPVRTHRKFRVGTKEDQVTFILGESGVLANREINTSSLHAQYRSGALEAADPRHPLLDCLRALHNRRCLLDWIAVGNPYHLAIEATCARTRYIAGAHVQAAAIQQSAIQTTDLSLASALGIVGIPILRIEGSAPSRRFTLPATGLDMRGVTLDASVIQAGILDGTLAGSEPEHPVLWGRQAVANYDVLRRVLNAEPTMLFVEDDKFGSGRAALLRENHAGIAMDHTRRFFARR